MKHLIIILFITTITGFFVATASQQSEDTNVGWSALIIKLINSFLTNKLPEMLQSNLTLIKSAGFEFPEFLHYLVEGSVNITEDVQIWGLYNTNTSNKLGYCSATNVANTTSLWLNLPISEMGIALGYAIDLGILRSIPIYGSGNIVIAVSKVEVNVSLNIINADVNPFKNLSIENLSFSEFSIRPAHSYITGFWYNPEADQLITNIINIIEDVVILLIRAEKDCFVCVLEAVIQYVLNVVLQNRPTLIIDCPCLKNIEGELYESEDIIADGITKFTSGELKQIIEHVFDENHRDFYSKAYNAICLWIGSQKDVQTIKALIN